MKIKVSIISINYKVEKELIACISSIVKLKPKVSYEIIVVDNDEDSKIKKTLKEKFPQVKYVKSLGNIGFGAGNNLGVKFASGEFLFFLNPDTIVIKNAVDVLYNFTKNNPSAGMVAPLLLDPKKNIYPSQGSNEYNLVNTLVINSFINKHFPNNPISKKFLHKDWNKKDVEEFDVVPGTAFMIRKNIFEEAQMFDEEFFLYFEEYDLAKRIKRLGYRNYIIPQAKISHIWEASTKKRKDIDKIFSQSRYLFFKKYYGLAFAIIIELFLRLGPYELMLGLGIIASIFLGFFRINELMTFIGDQGWFYLSSRDMLVNGDIPLVGIASSRPWLHQGPLWTYLLAFSLWIFDFHPVSGAYMTILLGILSVFVMFVVSSVLFSKRVGLISSLIYATSPLVIFNLRFPYHTSPIPLFAIALIFSLYKIIQNKHIYLPLTIFLMSILYNFEIATVVLWPVIIAILGYKLFKNEIHFKEILNKKILTLSAIAFVVPLLPMILYDVSSGFPQTLKFAAWVFYRVVSLLGFNQQHVFSIEKIIVMLNFFFNNFTKLVFPQSSFVAFFILVALMSWMVYFIIKKKDKKSSFNLIFLIFFAPMLLIILNQTPSNAYLPILFPVTAILFSIFLDYVMSIKRMLIPIVILIFIIVVSNINFLLKNDFAFSKEGRMFTLAKRQEAAYEILNVARNKDYNLKGEGPGSEYKSFTANYEYLMWWLDKPPSKKHERLQFVISETEKGIIVEEIGK